MVPPKQQNLPIGYWLKKVDELLTQHISQVQADNGVSRLEWQTLNALHEAGKPTAARELPVIDVFVDSSGLTDILIRFVKQGWAETVGSEPVTYVLSEAGEVQHGVILTAQKGVRQCVMNGVSEEEYCTVFRVLQQMAENLEVSR